MNTTSLAAGTIMGLISAGLATGAGITTTEMLGRRVLGRVDGFDQDEAESKRDERAIILRRLLASKCDTLEAFELADRFSMRARAL